MRFEVTDLALGLRRVGSSAAGPVFLCCVPPGGVLGRWKGGEVRPRSLNPDPVYDKAYKNFHTLFMKLL